MNNLLFIAYWNINLKKEVTMKKLFWKLYYRQTSHGYNLIKFTYNFRTYRHLVGNFYWLLTILFLFLYSNITISQDKQINIAIIDTGYKSPNSPELIKYRPQQICEYKNFTSRHNDNDLLHGTHIIGLIANKLNKTNIKYCFYILQYHWIGGNDSYINALEYASNIKDLKYLNLSLSGQKYIQRECDLIEKLLKNHVKVIVSAGNDSLDLSQNDVYPAKCNNKLYVIGNLDENSVKAKDSNYGLNTMFWEYGQHQISLGLQNNLISLSGTSQAAANFTANLIIKDNLNEQ